MGRLRNVQKTSRSVLSEYKNTGVAKCFYFNKTHAASFLNGFKNIP